MQIKPKILNRAIEYLEAGEDMMGLCLSCGCENDCVEPDARGYECESCGEPQVYSCEEILIMSLL